MSNMAISVSIDQAINTQLSHLKRWDNLKSLWGKYKDFAPKAFWRFLYRHYVKVGLPSEVLNHPFFDDLRIAPLRLKKRCLPFRWSNSVAFNCTCGQFYSSDKCGKHGVGNWVSLIPSSYLQVGTTRYW